MTICDGNLIESFTVSVADNYFSLDLWSSLLGKGYGIAGTLSDIDQVEAFITVATASLEAS